MLVEAQGHLCTTQKELSPWSGCVTYMCSLIFVLSSSHLSKMACHWKADWWLHIYYRIRLCLCLSPLLSPGKITPPYLGKTPLTLLLPLGNILVHFLVLHPRPKARLCLPIPLVTSYLSANRVLWGWTEHWGVTSAPVPIQNLSWMWPYLRTLESLSPHSWVNTEHIQRNISHC